MLRQPAARLLLVLLLAASLLPARRIVADPPPVPTQVSARLEAVSHTDDLAAQPASVNGEIVLYPSDDAPVREGAPASTAKDEAYLGAGWDNGSLYGSNGRIRSYLRFDLSGLPSGSTIVSATLHLTQAAGQDYPGDSRTVTFFRVTGNWNEATLTWNNKPDYAESVGSVSSTYDYVGSFDLNLTSLVSAWYGGSQSNYGVIAIGPENVVAGIYRAFFSKGFVGQPELRVRYVPAPPPVLDASPGTITVRASSTQIESAPPLRVSNVTRGSLNWVAAKVGSASWLTLTQSSGSATPTTPDALGYTLSAAGLSPGTYTEQIRVSSSTPNVVGSPLTVTVSLEVVNQLSRIYLPLITKSTSGSASTPPIVALVIGVADYQYLGPAPSFGNLPDVWGYDLAAPFYDVNDMVAVLTGMGVPPDRILKYGESAATYTNITGAIGGAGQQAATASAFELLDQMEDENSIVIIYYSGHGGQTPDTNGDESDGLDEFIAMYDTELITSTNPDHFVRMVTDDELQGLLASLESKHIIVILDSCYSGSMMSASAQAQSARQSDLLQRGLLSPSPSKITSSDAAMSELIGPGRIIITAGTGDQITWESSSLQNGVFTYFYLQSLQDALHDANGNGYVSAEEAYWFSRDAVDDWIAANVVSTTVIHQNPDINDQRLGQVDLKRLP